MANEDRLSATVLADIEQQAQEGLRGGLLEQVWGRRALALVREIRLLWHEVGTTGAEKDR
ncbi:MAG TPA: hypothetical protein VGR43_02585 [Dehalococcoidia bacterium]|jgi:hypothetical protein|nr:hypothetical protein [Dehalococcoidia bacterium]